MFALPLEKRGKAAKDPSNSVEHGSMTILRTARASVRFPPSLRLVQGWFARSQMQVVAVEVSGLGQLAPVADMDRARARPLDQPLRLQHFDRSVHMNRGETGSVGKLVLR